MRLICDTAASCACKIGRSASPATGAGPGATTSARGDHLRERRTGPRRAWRSELPFGCLRIVPQVVRQLAGAQSHQPISQYFESRKRPVRDALQQQSVLVVGQELQALEDYACELSTWPLIHDDRHLWGTHDTRHVS